jgi:Ubiquitin-like autophagy protein Apg12
MSGCEMSEEMMKDQSAVSGLMRRKAFTSWIILLIAFAPRTMSREGNTGGDCRVILKPLSDAPRLTTSHFTVNRGETVRDLSEFLHRLLALPIHLYLSDVYCPPGDQSVGSLAACYAVDGVLLLSYSLQKVRGNA